MKRLALVVLLVVGCATRAPHLNLTPADSASHGGEFESLAMAVLLVLVLIPTLAKRK